jgi:hypothetical protein
LRGWWKLQKYQPLKPGHISNDFNSSLDILSFRPPKLSKAAAVSKCLNTQLGVTSPCRFKLHRDLSLDPLFAAKIRWPPILYRGVTDHMLYEEA